MTKQKRWNRIGLQGTPEGQPGTIAFITSQTTKKMRARCSACFKNWVWKKVFFFSFQTPISNFQFPISNYFYILYISSFPKVKFIIWCYVYIYNWYRLHSWQLICIYTQRSKTVSSPLNLCCKNNYKGLHLRHCVSLFTFSLFYLILCFRACLVSRLSEDVECWTA